MKCDNQYPLKHNLGSGQLLRNIYYKLLKILTMAFLNYSLKFPTGDQFHPYRHLHRNFDLAFDLALEMGSVGKCRLVARYRNLNLSHLVENS